MRFIILRYGFGLPSDPSVDKIKKAVKNNFTDLGNLAQEN
jgi:hypothetical protein